jgi:hypothetical protein
VDLVEMTVSEEAVDVVDVVVTEENTGVGIKERRRAVRLVTLLLRSVEDMVRTLKFFSESNFGLLTKYCRPWTWCSSFLNFSAHYSFLPNDYQGVILNWLEKGCILLLLRHGRKGSMGNQPMAKMKRNR